MYTHTYVYTYILYTLLVCTQYQLYIDIYTHTLCMYVICHGLTPSITSMAGVVEKGSVIPEFAKTTLVDYSMGPHSATVSPQEM